MQGATYLFKSALHLQSTQWRVNADGLHTAAERIRSLVEKSQIRENGIKLQVTVSIGGTLATNDDTTESILKRADKLLYQSKENGRNRCTIG